jgi:hypothetical protein
MVTEVPTGPEEGEMLVIVGAVGEEGVPAARSMLRSEMLDPDGLIEKIQRI